MERETPEDPRHAGRRRRHPAGFAVSAHTNRVAGDRRPHGDGVGRLRAAGDAWTTPSPRWDEFRASPCVAGLPSSPTPPIEIDPRPDRPQPRLDLERGRGMAVTVGRVRPCTLLDLRIRRAGAQHHPRRGGRGGADRGAARGRRPRGRGRDDRLQVRRYLGAGCRRDPPPDRDHPRPRRRPAGRRGVGAGQGHRLAPGARAARGSGQRAGGRCRRPGHSWPGTPIRRAGSPARRRRWSRSGATPRRSAAT